MNQCEICGNASATETIGKFKKQEDGKTVYCGAIKVCKPCKEKSLNG